MKYNKRLIVAVILIVGIIVLRYSGLFDWFNFQNFKENRHQFLDLVHNNYILSVLSFIFVYFLVIISSLPLAFLLNIISGFLFGAILGTLYSNIGGTLGATVAFLTFRYLLGNYVQKKYANRLEKFNKNFEEYGANYLLLINLTGIFPFFVVNMLAAMTRVSVWTFIWTTSIGIIPSSFIYAYAGKQLGSITRISEIFSFKVILAFLLLITFAVLALLWKRFKIKND